MYKRGKASNVFIEKNLVEKVFDYDVDKGYRGNGQQSYQREKEALLRLKGNKHFPQIINFDDDKRLIQMSYCGEPYPFDGKPRPHLLEQVWEISEAIEKANIKLLGFGLQTNNILLHDGVLKIIDFEYSLPEGMKEIDEFDPRFLKHIRDNWDVSFWENCFKILLVTGDILDKRSYHKYEEGLRKANNMIKNEWNNYQKSNEGNSAKWRIENLDLRQFASKDKTLLDLGANHGEFGVELAKDFMHVSAVEPVVEAPENMPENMTWFKKTLKEFCADHNDTYDVVFSFAMTIQVRDNDGLNEDEIAQRHYDLVKENGMMIYETQKLENRPLNQAHVDKMLKSFRDKFGNETSSGNARTSGKRKYYIFKK